MTIYTVGLAELILLSWRMTFRLCVILIVVVAAAAVWWGLSVPIPTDPLLAVMK